MAIGLFPDKKTDEYYYVFFDFAEDLDEDTISSAVVTAKDALGADKTTTITTAANQVISEKVVAVWVTGGTAQRYTIKCAIVSSTGEAYNKSAYMTVISE